MMIDRFTAAGFEVTVHPTQERGDAIAQAKQVCDSGLYDILVCSGGDGTLNEVIQGYMLSENQCPIGYIPFGSTNDFARGLGIPTDPEEAVDCIIHGEALPCDIGGFNDKYFTYVAAFGAFTEISYQTSQQFKNVLGHAAYILNGLSKLSRIRACRMRIEYDGGVIEDEFLYGMVTNSSSVARFLAKPYLHYFRTSKLKVTNLDEEPVSWTIDGEYGGTERVNRIVNNQKAVQFWIDPVRRKQAEENRDGGLAVVMPPPEESMQPPEDQD